MFNVEYARAEPRHIKQILEIENMCFSVPWTEASYAAEFEDGLAHYFVALLDGGVIGYCGYWEIVGEGHITNVAVHPGYQKHGVGSGLMGKLINYAFKSGIRSFTLEVREDNIPAVRLYNKFGFVSMGIRKNYYQKEKKHALIMWKHIDEPKN